MTKRNLKLNDENTEIRVICGTVRANVAGDFGYQNVGDMELSPTESAKNLLGSFLTCH